MILAEQISRMLARAPGAAERLGRPPAELVTADPRGRVDVLAYRVIEKLALRQCPREWPLLRRAAWDLCHRRPRPATRRRRRRR